MFVPLVRRKSLYIFLIIFIDLGLIIYLVESLALILRVFYMIINSQFILTYNYKYMNNNKNVRA